MKMCGIDFKMQGRLVRIARLTAEKYDSMDDPERVLDGLRKSGTRIDLFTFIQRISEATPKYRYPMEWDNFAALPLTTFDHWWNRQIDGKARNMARKAEKKGIVVREAMFDDTLVRGIWEIYNECPIRQGRRFPHYGKDIETVRAEAATFPDRSIFIGAFLDDKLIGFSKLVTDETRTQAGLMNILSMIQHRDKAPTNALIAQAVRSCAERGILYLWYSNFAYGKKRRDTLTDFKEHNGFLRVDVPRYYVPLTRTGSLALRLGLHRKLVEYLPESLAAKLREIRNAWYNRKFNSLKEAS